MNSNITATKLIASTNACLLYGDICLINDYKHQLYPKLKTKGYTLCKRYQLGYNNWDEVLAISTNLELFAEKQIIELQGQLQKEAAAKIQQLVTNTSIFLLIIAPSITTKTKASAWFKKLIANVTPIEFKVPSALTLPKWILQYAKDIELKIQPELAKYLAANYHANTIAITNILGQLKELYPFETLTIAKAAPFLSFNNNYSIFDLTKSIEDADPPNVIKILNNLKLAKVEPSLIIWHLGQILRIILAIKTQDPAKVMREYNLWDSRYKKLVSLSKNKCKSYCCNLISRLSTIDRNYKTNVNFNIWEELTNLSINLSGDHTFLKEAYV